MGNSITIVFITLCIWAFSINGNAQTFELPKSKKLQIGISTSKYSFFDDHSLIQNGFGFWYYWLKQTRGYEAIYFFNKNGIRLSYNNVEINYPSNTYPKPLVAIYDRNYQLYNIEYLRKIYTYKKTELHLSGGMTFRTGSESVIFGDDWYGCLIDGYFADGFGLSLGTYIIAPIYKGLNVNLGLKYTEFVHRKYTGGQFEYDDGGLLSVCLGLR